MRQSVILPAFHEELFIQEAKNAGLITVVPGLSEAIPGIESTDDILFYRHLAKRAGIKWEDCLRTIILFDEVIMPSAPDAYDYSYFENSGCFKIATLDECLDYSSMITSRNPLQAEENKLHALQLKPAIMPILEQEFRKYFRVLPSTRNYKDLLSDLYDATLLHTPIPSKYEGILELNKILYDARNEERQARLDRYNPPAILKKEYAFFTTISSEIITYFEDLSWQLQLSTNYDSTIMNCRYNLANIGCEAFSEKSDLALEAYKILRIEYGKIIGTLPTVSTIQEAIQLRESRRQDLHNLRQELSHLEFEIKNGASKKAIDQASKDLSSASRALSIGTSISKVENWTTHCLLPLGIAAMVSQSPEIAIGTGVITAVGQAAKIAGEAIVRHNSWMELII